MPKTILLSLAALVPLTALARSPSPGGEACRQAAELEAKIAREGQRELFFAVLEGLYADGVSNEAVDAILAVDPSSGLPANFVEGCPICVPAQEAFRAYRSRPESRFKRPFGDGLDPALERMLIAGTPEQRFERSGRLVQGWIERRLESLRLTAEERAAWGRMTEAWREKGMAMLEDIRSREAPGIFAGRKSCQMCDAAKAACGR